MRKKWLALIIVAAILAVSIPLTLTLIHQGAVPPDDGGSDVPADNSTAPSPLAVLSTADGNVLVMEAGTNAWAEAQVGMSLKTGDSIKTGAGSGAEITFLDGSTIELQASTQIDIASLRISTETGSKTIQLKQTIGDTISRVTHLVDSASSYEIETPTCVAAVRGSSMEVKVGADGTTWVTNLQGHIVVIVDGVELEVPLGRTAVITPGEAPYLLPPSGGGGGGGGGFTPQPDIAIIKMADVMQALPGDAINYTYIVANPGNVPLSSVSVTDDRINAVIYQGGDTDGDGLLDTNESWVFTATYNVTAQDPSPLTNTASASGTYGSRTVISWAVASVDILQPAIAITNTANSTQVHDGGAITYTYTVTNPGGMPISDVWVTDSFNYGVNSPDGMSMFVISVNSTDITYESGDDNEDGVLDGNEAWVFDRTYVAIEDASPLVNTATVYGIDSGGQTVTAYDTVAVDILRPDIMLTIIPDPAELLPPFPESVNITWTYSVTNTGNTLLSDVYVASEMVRDPLYQSGDTNDNGMLDTAETWIFTGYYTTGDIDPLYPPGEWATASGSDALGMRVYCDAQAYVYVPPPVY